MSIHSDNGQEEEGKAPLLNLPPFKMKLTREEGMLKVFDPIRRKAVKLTPEEYVRQHFVNWLISGLHYPASHIANEVQIMLNGTIRRCDTIIFENASTPLMIVEYKAPDVAVTQDVFDQIVRYNMTLRARYLVVSNGIRHYCCRIDYSNGSYHFIPKVPDWRELNSIHSEN